MYHYVYKVTHKITNQYYFGSRSCKCNPELDVYFGSQRTWKLSKSDKSEFLIKDIIESNFKSRDLAIQYEAILIERYINDPLNENYHIPPNRFHTVGRTNIIDSNGIISTISTDEYRNGNFIHCNSRWKKGKILAKDVNGKTYLVDKEDPRYLSGEIFGINKGFVTVKDSKGIISRVSVDDPRYLSGEFISQSKDKVTTRDIDGNILVVDIKDPRYINGELIHIAKGHIPWNKGTPPIEEYKDGILINTWKDLEHMHEDTKISKSTICGWIKKGRNNSKGYSYKYKHQ